jgi:hypothetical protein
LVLSALGLVGLAVQRRWGLLALTGLAFMTTVAFNLVYTIGDIFVLYTPAHLILTLWLGAGVGFLVQALSGAWSRFQPGGAPGLEAGKRGKRSSSAILAIAVGLPFFALPAWIMVARYSDVDQSSNTKQRERWETILAEPLPQDAVLVSNDRNDIMPMWYFQFVGDESPLRPDLLGLFPQITAEYPTLGHVVDLALSTGRPVYLIKEMPGIEVRASVEKEGDLWRVVGSATAGAPEFPSGAGLGSVLSLTGYDLLPQQPRPGETVLVGLVWEVLAPLDADYHSFVHLLDADAERVTQSDQQPGGVYYPSTLWRPGEFLRDQHALELPNSLAPGTYSLLVGMYAPASDGTLAPLGAPVIAGQVRIED